MKNSPLSDIDPEEALDRALASRMTEPLVVPFTLAEPWNRGAPRRLTAVYRLTRSSMRPKIEAFVTDAPVRGNELCDDIARAAMRYGAALIDFDEPLVLAPVSVAKPWGHELWHTGMEQRGVAAVQDECGRTPLPWIIAAAPGRLTDHAPIALLKTLAPHPVPVHGDLYFELHEQKHEVYVVTRVDRSSRPDGVGAVRFGMNQALRDRYADDETFRRDYLVAVQRYEAVRRRIDALHDARRRVEGLTANEPVEPQTLERWQAGLDPELIAEERSLREAMNAFTELVPLSEGDVVRVPPWLPHALQHGVRVVELQSPVYERRILSFAQKVLTQDHWDTAHSVARMRLDSPPLAEAEVLEEGAGRTVERIAQLDDVTALRVHLDPGCELELPKGAAHVLVVGLEGSMVIGRTTLAPDTACLVPHGALHRMMRNAATGSARALVAARGL